VVWAAGLLTLAPGCPHGDSGETAAVALHMGIAHPPGYPLPTLLSVLFVRIVQMGTVAWRVSLLSLAAAGLAAVVVSMILGREFPSIPRPLLALLGVMAGLGLELWNQMTLPKGSVYTVTAALLGIMVFSIAALSENRGRMTVILGLAVGMGFGGHYMILMPFLPFLGALVVIPFFKRQERARGLVMAGVFAILGVSVYLYIPLRTPSAHPALRWAEPVTAKRFAWLVFRQQYLSIEKQPHGTVGWLMAGRFAERFGQGYSLLAPVVAAGAVVLAFRLKAWWVILLGVGAFTEVAAAAFYPKLEEDSLWVADPYFTTGWLALGIVMAWGIAGAARALGRAGVAAAWVVALLITGWAVVAGVTGVDKSRNYYASDGQADLAGCLPRNSLFFCEGDANIAPMLYGLYVDEQRPDVRVIIPIFLHFGWGLEQLHEQYPDLVLRELEPWDSVWQMAADIVQAHPARPAVYTLTTSKGWPFVPYAKPEGLFYGLIASDEVVSDRRIDVALGRLRMRGILSGDMSREPFSRVIRENLVGAFFRRGLWWFTRGENDMALHNFERAIRLQSPEAALNAGMIHFNRGDGDRAGVCWNQAREWAPGRPEPYVNLGLLALRRMHIDEAISMCQRAIDLDPGLVKAYEVLASAAYFKGNRKAALAYLERAMSLDPKDERLKRAAQAMTGGAKGSPRSHP